MAERRAVAIVRSAASLSPAYRTLLAEAGINIDRWSSAPDWSALPVLTKDNSFGRFALDELCGPSFDPGDIADVLTSSGRGGRVYGFRLSRRKHHDRSWFDVDLGLQDAFDVDRIPTLVVNCLPMGVVFGSRAVTVANVSVREDMAAAILKQVGPRYGQVIVCTDPLFVLRLLDHAQAVGIDWGKLNASFILGEEMLVEAQRDYISTKIGLAPDASSRRLVASSFGVGELGLNLLFETRETVAMRRALHRDPKLRYRLGISDQLGESVPSVFCYNPLRTKIEVIASDADGFGELCFTLLSGDAVIPLPRYATGDRGRLLGIEEESVIAKACGVAPWLPVVLVSGRIADRRADGVPSVESVKDAIYANHGLADRLNGAFRIGSGPDGVLRLVLQARGRAATDSVAGNALVSEAQAWFHSRWQRPVRIELAAHPADSWAPPVDYERKFDYHLPAEGGLAASR